MALVGSHEALATALKNAVSLAVWQDSLLEPPLLTLSQRLQKAFLDDEASAAQDNPALTALCALLTEHVVARIVPMLCDAIAPALIAHIAANASVSPIGLPAPMSNSGGPVVGAGSIL